MRYTIGWLHEIHGDQSSSVIGSLRREKVNKPPRRRIWTNERTGMDDKLLFMTSHKTDLYIHRVTKRNPFLVRVRK